MNDIQVYDENAVTKLMATDSWKVSMYGRSAQDGLHTISNMMTRISDISGKSQMAQASVLDAFKPLMMNQKTSFMQRIFGTATPPMTPHELRQKVDLIIATLVKAEQELMKSRAVIEMTKIKIDEVYDNIHKKYVTLIEVAERTQGDMSKTALDTAREMTISMQVAENMKLNLVLIYKDVLHMQIRNDTILDNHVPLWDKIIDNLDAADVAAAEKARLQIAEVKKIAEAKEIDEEKKIDVPVAGTLEM